MRAPRSHGGPAIETVLGGLYRIVELIGVGGTSDVYLAQRTSFSDGSSHDRVALKLLREEHRLAPAMIARFEREATAAALVHHPNVLDVYGTDHLHDARRFFAMEHLVGLDLADTLAHERSLRPERAVRIAHAAAEGLGAAHLVGVIHRDVKPENIFLVHAADGREVVKLLDFGFAWIAGDPSQQGSTRITAPQSPVGTPEYMSPEQAYGAPAHGSADIYSVGVVLYEMLSGRVPFSGDSYAAIAYQHASQPLPDLRHRNPSLSASDALIAVVCRALAKTPSERFDTMAAFSAALEATPEWERAKAGALP